ncbi:hypothetical protein DFP72DRAFT_1074504 [Ephemerocybe angulata]|uniref:Uncharacterized protein n=1 Tax=Ephemerocybe angulata TaxID=980116 RepID=A0A8H6HKW0_9AGAR|nr:hypothetical protein DFP72DRAFT_1074504 [Tulosesus angulatus]
MRDHPCAASGDVTPLRVLDLPTAINHFPPRYLIHDDYGLNYEGPDTPSQIPAIPRDAIVHGAQELGREPIEKTCDFANCSIESPTTAPPHSLGALQT